MKRSILISTFLFAFLLPLCPSDRLELTYRMLKSSKTLEVLIGTDSVSMKAVMRQSKDGHFSIESPPFIVADLDGLVRIGELKPSRILQAMLDPFSDADLYGGFKAKANLKRTESPSLSPRFSGVALCFPNLDLVAFNPVLNPDSPTVFGMVAGNDAAFAAIMHANQNGKVSDDFQTDWRRTGTGRNMIFSMIGASAEAEVLGLSIQSVAFVQSAWDLLLGGGTTTAWSFRAGADRLEIKADRKLGGFGPVLKDTDEHRSPVEELKSFINISDGLLALRLTYSSETYEKPVYGGKSQERLIEYNTSVSFRGITVDVKHSTAFESDCGKSSMTIYSASAKAKDAVLKASVTLQRPAGKNPSLTDPELEVRLEQAKLAIKDDKASLELSLEREIEACRFKLSIDQDRMITATLKFSK